MNWIFTGFEPWDDLDYNPSWDVAQSAAKSVGGQAILLPVTFDIAHSVDAFISTDEPNVVHFGVAIARDQIAIERYAHNIDNQNRRLDPDGPVARETSCDVLQLASLVGGTVSRDAGDFVCNAIYYQSLKAASTRLFIHVPMMTPEVAEEVGAVIADALVQTTV